MPHTHDIYGPRPHLHGSAVAGPRPDSLHGPDTARRAAGRARAILAAEPRTELAGAAEFLRDLLRVPEISRRPAVPGPEPVVSRRSR